MSYEAVKRYERSIKYILWNERSWSHKAKYYMNPTMYYSRKKNRTRETVRSVVSRNVENGNGWVWRERDFRVETILYDTVQVDTCLCAFDTVYISNIYLAICHLSIYLCIQRWFDCEDDHFHQWINPMMFIANGLLETHRSPCYRRLSLLSECHRVSSFVHSLLPWCSTSPQIHGNGTSLPQTKPLSQINLSLFKGEIFSPLNDCQVFHPNNWKVTNVTVKSLVLYSGDLERQVYHYAEKEQSLIISPCGYEYTMNLT